MGRYCLIVVSGFALIFGWVKGNLDRVGEGFTDNFLVCYEKAAAKLAANSAAHMSLVTLSDSLAWRAGYSSVPLGEGTGGAALFDAGADTSLGPGQVRIDATGSCGSATASAIMMSIVPFVPVGVRGGITANSQVKDLGSLVIDGRDHDINGSLIPGQGTYGISTTQTVTQGGASMVGGTAGGTDYVPSTPANPAILDENATYTFPSTPDEVFGYDGGTLTGRGAEGQVSG